MKINYLIFSLIPLLLFSCKRDVSSTYEDGTGDVEISVTTESLTKAENLNLNPDDFKLEIINSQGVIFKRWNTYREYKNQEDTKIRMNAGGPYKVRATYGDSTSYGFNAIYFKGEQSFTVVPQQITSLSVVCTQGNVKVAVVYGDNLRHDYPDYYSSVSLKGTSKKLTFTKDMTGCGYLPSGDLYFYLTATDGNGKNWYFRTDTNITGAGLTALPGDSVTFKVDTKAIPTYEIDLSISIDSSTEDSTVTIDLPMYMLPVGGPKVTLEGFNATTSILSYTEGTLPASAAINISAGLGIKACTLAVNSTYLRSLGWPDSIDFFNIPTDTKNILLRDGLLWSENMSGLTLANIDFKNVAKIIKYKDTFGDSQFTLHVVDDRNQTITKDFSLSPAAAQTAVSSISAGDVWATKMSCLLTTDGDASLLSPEIKTDSESSVWTKPAYTSSVSSSGNRVTITGITPGTKYYVRACYNYGSSTAKDFTTEVAAQVGNAGFESWTDGTRYSQPFYQPWTDDRWWDSNSIETMQSSYSTYVNYKCFPTTWYTTDCHSGSKAAQVRSIAVNGANSEWMGTGSVKGKLFIGSMADNKTITQGHSFTSRPSVLEFYYKFTSVNSEVFSATIEILNGTTVIGSGTANFGGTSSWTKGTVALSYSVTNQVATTIHIMIISPTADSPSTSKQTITIPAGSKKVYTGSCLTIDDINLTY